jgi:Uma2 family endonuclease
MGMAAPIYYTAEMVRALPDDGKRYETVHGELFVTPAPRAPHQWVVGKLYLALGNYLERHPVAQLFMAPADISWGPDTLVQPDLFVVPLEETRPLEWARMRTLQLVIEVLSPSTSRADRFAKRRLYQEVGVPHYWMVDPDRRAAELWTPEARFPVHERERLVWHPASAPEPCLIPLATVLPPVS